MQSSGHALLMFLIRFNLQQFISFLYMCIFYELIKCDNIDFVVYFSARHVLHV